MKRFLFPIVIVGVALLLMSHTSGVATETHPVVLGDAPRSATAQGEVAGTPSDLAFYYRYQAAQLEDMARLADRLVQLEAQRDDQEEAQRSRVLARDLRAAAAVAREIAMQFQALFPLGPTD